MRIRCGLALVGMLVLAMGRLAAQKPILPELPRLDLADFPAEARPQLQEAYDAARAQPRSAEASGKLGMLLAVYERHEAAVACYQRAHGLDPTAFRWLYYLGLAQAKRSRNEEAVATLRVALQINPNYLPAQLKLAETLLAAGKWDEGDGVYEKILKKHPDATEAWYGKGRILAARGDLAAAVDAYRQACELFPNYGAAHYALALAYRKLGKADESRQHLEAYAGNKTLVPPVDDPLRDEMRALDLGALSNLRRGIALEQVGRIEDSIAAHEKALELDPQLEQAHANLIILYGRTKQPQKAEEHFRAAVRLNPNHADSYYNYGLLLLGQGKYGEAEEAFQKAVAINPFYSQAWHNLGVMRERQGRLDEALQFYRKAVERQPDFPLAHFHIGRILANQKKYDEAISHFLKTLSPEDDSTPAYLYALAATYARAGNREDALRYGRRAREQATARGQTELLRSIDRDLRTLEATPPH